MLTHADARVRSGVVDALGKPGPATLATHLVVLLGKLTDSDFDVFKGVLDALKENAACSAGGTFSCLS